MKMAALGVVLDDLFQAHVEGRRRTRRVARLERGSELFVIRSIGNVSRPPRTSARWRVGVPTPACR